MIWILGLVTLIANKTVSFVLYFYMSKYYNLNILSPNLQNVQFHVQLNNCFFSLGVFETVVISELYGKIILLVIFFHNICSKLLSMIIILIIYGL